MNYAKMCLMVFAVLCSGMVGAEERLSEHPTIVELHKEAIRVREQAGLRRHYQLDEECCKLAQRHANWMASNHNMSHGPNDQIIAAGYPTVRSAIAGWRSSGPHWSWLAGGSDRCGFGYQRASNGTCYWAGVFRSGARSTIEREVTVTVSNDGYSYSSGKRVIRRR